MLINKDEEIPDSVKKELEKLNVKDYRITLFLESLRFLYNIDEWDILDEKNIMNGPFYSYLIDEQIRFNNGESVNTDEIYNAILTVGDFSQKEKRLFEQEKDIDYKIW